MNSNIYAYIFKDSSMSKINTNWLTMPEAAEYLRCGERFLRELVTNKKIPHVIFAGKAIFYPNRIDEWLLAQEIGWTTKKQTKKEIIPEEVRKISLECAQQKVNDIIRDILNYKDGKEPFVNSLGKDLSNDLEKSEYTILSEKVYSRLSRWCHPKRESPRNNWVQEKAQNISKLLYGKVIEREVLPSYRS